LNAFWPFERSRSAPAPVAPMGLSVFFTMKRFREHEMMRRIC
jgi:hypothetical protein